MFEEVAKFFKSDKNVRPTVPRNSINLTYRKHNTTTPKHIIIKLLKSSDKEKILKRIQASGLVYKELGTHHSIRTINKKLNKMKNQQFLKFVREVRLQGKPLSPKLERRSYREPQLIGAESSVGTNTR